MKITHPMSFLSFSQVGFPKRRNTRSFFPALLLAATALLAPALSKPTLAQPSSLTGTYFRVPSNHPDFNRGTQDSANVPGLVESYLGPNGLPVRSEKGRTYPGPTPPLGSSGPITDVNAQNEILWWSNTSTITNRAVLEKVQTNTLPFAFTNFYPDGQSNDNTFLRAVHYQGTFNISGSQTVTFISDVDDELFGYVDGKLVIDLGGIVHRPVLTTNITGLAPGLHTLDLFFVDRQSGGSQLSFSSNVVISATGAAPEPGSLALLLPILGIAFRQKRRKN